MNNTKDYPRSDRIAQLLSRGIAELIQFEINDPRVSELTVTDVEVSQDLRHADIFVVSQDSKDKAKVEQSMRSLKKAGKFIRHRLLKTLDLRRCPDLHFKYDFSIQHGADMSALIDSAIGKEEVSMAEKESLENTKEDQSED